MQLRKGLEILVEDWRDLHRDGGAKQTVADVVGKLNPGKAIPTDLKPARVVEMLLDNLGRIPGALENSEKFMAQFDSAAELLEEIDLDCLVSDLAEAEEDQ